MTTEKTLLNDILLACSRGCVRLFRANAGVAWIGKITGRTPTSITIENPRAFHGMIEGFPDLVGWRSVTITPEMVGSTLAVFVVVEGKLPGRKPSAEQSTFRRIVLKAGGVAIVARSVAEVSDVLTPHPPGDRAS